MSVLVIDFGSQVTQLIARRVREAGVYCEIVPYNKAEVALAKKPQAIILSGGPASVTEDDTPRAPQAVFQMGVPVLGICYGEMTMCAQLGGKVEAGHNREFGRADIHVTHATPLLEGLAESGSEPVWMSHGDKITAIPPGFAVVATSESALCGDRRRDAPLHGVQFHPKWFIPRARHHLGQFRPPHRSASRPNGTCMPSAPRLCGENPLARSARDG